jgi:hypothetical protein
LEILEQFDTEAQEVFLLKLEVSIFFHLAMNTLPGRMEMGRKYSGGSLKVKKLGSSSGGGGGGQKSKGTKRKNKK